MFKTLPLLLTVTTVLPTVPTPSLKFAHTCGCCDLDPAVACHCCLSMLDGEDVGEAKWGDARSCVWVSDDGYVPWKQLEGGQMRMVVQGLCNRIGKQGDMVSDLTPQHTAKNTCCA